MIFDQLIAFIGDTTRMILSMLLLTVMVLSLLAVLMGASPGAIGATLAEASDTFFTVVFEILCRLPALLVRLGAGVLRLMLALLAAWRR